MKTMFTNFDQHISENFEELKHGKFILAVSGGVDSVVLAHLFDSIGVEFFIAHCNFQLRGQESDQDEAFVRNLGESLGKEVYVRKFQTEQYAKENKVSIQMAARELRYQWFDRLGLEIQNPLVVTAHHADDNLETFLINLLRGTGLKGLLGIPETNLLLRRPLLAYSRKDIEAYAKEHQIQWREDSTNSSAKYIRNRLRHEVIPVLKEINPQLLQVFAQTQRNLRDSDRLAEGYIQKVMREVIDNDEYGFNFDIPKLRQLPNAKTVLYEALKLHGFTSWEDIHDLLYAQSGKAIFSPTAQLLKDRDKLHLTNLPVPDDFYLEINEGEKKVKIPNGHLYFEEAAAIEPHENNMIFVDQTKIKFPLVVRRWKEGDHFYPFGMKGSKKLSKFFKDIKLSILQKQNCLIMLSGDQIVWIVGHRLDDRFKVDQETTSILKVTSGI